MILQTKTISLIKRVLKFVAPPPDIKVSEWSEENIVLSSEYAAIPGRYSVDRTPYQREMMDAFNDPLIQKIVIMSSSQVGKNTVINNIIGYIIDNDPGPILMIEPSIKMAEDYSKRRIAPLIRDTKCLSKKVGEAKSRDSNNTILSKSFPGGSLVLVGSNAPRDLASKPIRVVIADEIDGFEKSAGTEGDPIDLAEKRAIRFWNRKLIYVSTPGIEGSSRIKPEYEAGTQEEWCIECPHCGEYVFININGVKFQHSKDEKGNYEVWDVVFQCPACLEEYDEYVWKSQPGDWISRNPNAKSVRSFRLNAFVAPVLTWDAIMKEWLEVKKDPERYKVFKNTMLGETWEEKGEIEDEDTLLKRREEYPADLPEGVLILTCGVDVQGDRLEYEIVGWGKGEESWGIKRGFILSDPELPETWGRLDEVIDRQFKYTDGMLRTIACTFIDSGGHSTSAVYRYCKKRQAQSKYVFAIKGMGGPGYPLVYKTTRTKPDKKNKNSKDTENCILVILGVDSGKSSIMSKLKIKESGEGYCHFPSQEDKGYDQLYFKGLISEKVVYTKQKGRTVPQWQKVSENARNEPFDMRNYAFAALKLLNVDFEVLEKRHKEIRNAGVNKPKAQEIRPQKRTGCVSKGVEL